MPNTQHQVLNHRSVYISISLKAKRQGRGWKQGKWLLVAICTAVWTCTGRWAFVGMLLTIPNYWSLLYQAATAAEWYPVKLRLSTCSLPNHTKGKIRLSLCSTDSNFFLEWLWNKHCFQKERKMSVDDSTESAPLVKAQFNSSIFQETDFCVKYF